MMKTISRAVLISASPRRKALLGAFVSDLKVLIPKAKEVPVRTRKDLLTNARLKFSSVEVLRSELVLSADTAVFLGKTVLGKPITTERAQEMLEKLSGRWHEVSTAMVLTLGRKKIETIVTTKVHFRTLDKSTIEAYVATGEPLDKAGGYGIQGLGGLFIDQIVGDYYNVVGLPLPKLEEILEKNGYCLIKK
jgi:septum formation protein